MKTNQTTFDIVMLTLLQIAHARQYKVASRQDALRKIDEWGLALAINQEIDATEAYLLGRRFRWAENRIFEQLIDQQRTRVN